MIDKENLFQKQAGSYWISSTEETHYSPLEKDMEVDVAIVGGGMVGIATAYLLQKSGFKVAIFEKNKIATGASGHTTAKITSQHGLIYHNMISNNDLETATQYASSNQWAVSFIEDTIKELNIDCDYSKENAYIYTCDSKYLPKIKDEVGAAKRAGIDASFVEELPLPLPILGAVKFPNQGQFHPRKYVLSLAQHIEKKGALIFEGTQIDDIDRGSPCTINTKGGNIIRANKVVVACHYPFTNNIGFYFTRMVPQRSYLLGVKIKEELPTGMYISAESPTRSIRNQISKQEALLLIGGDSHQTAHGEEEKVHYSNLFDFVKHLYTVENVPYRWSTQDLMTPDDIPYIGKITSYTDHVYIATGFKKWGMTTSHVAAKVISDLISNNKSQWENLYKPYRNLSSKSILKLVVDNIQVAKDLVKGKLEDATNELPTEPGKGHTVEIDGEKIGAYMDKDGKIYLIDTTCTHLGCELKWNSAEKTWDCPCHGSRFDYKGTILDGPALDNLECKLE
ncbi:FAD-dependent oxidoreductase [Alkalibaculum bacchi]|uniref:FAD-dependent oxidoreductase n=1 Tax=Alkalibaculum bacchi TaxID=645887 RepID=UPI0026ED303C|nr:FAD-dependent oxidoreductase [Alkalibaculum bacchi]